MNAKRKVIIDCDPGIDDALALMLALSSSEIDVVGITIVCGNVPVEKGAENALKVLNLMGRLDIPVYLGENKPLKREYADAMDTHGEDGLGETWYPEVKSARPRQGAIKFLIEQLRNLEKLSIISIGPMTTIAKALMTDPEAFEFLEEFVSMGGNFRSYGNCSPVAEYNYWCDPDAACYVYEHLGKKIHMVGLDVTRKIVFTPTISEFCRCVNRERGSFARAITRFYDEFHWKYEGIIGCVINDPLAVAYFIDHSLCSGINVYTTVVTEGICLGQTVVDSMNFWKREKNSYVLTEVDEIGFMQFFLTRVFGATEQEVQNIL